MYQNIFKRYEKKYFLNQEQYDNVMNFLTYNTVPDKFGKSTVCNIYYDTPDYRLIRNSIEKPVYKEKLRLRCYNTPTSDSHCFLELKKKYKGVVYKRRINEKYLEGLDYLSGCNENIKSSQIKNEIDYFLGFYSNIRPTMDIFYDRTAFYDRSDKNIRFTFDSNIICRNYEFDLRNGIYGQEIIDKNVYLLEIKTTGAIPMWVSEMLSQFEIYPTNFSKYGTAYNQLILSPRGVEPLPPNNHNNKSSEITKFNGGIYCA